MLIRVLLIFIFSSLLGTHTIVAQSNNSLLQQNLSNVQADQITDDQLKQYIIRANEEGYTDEQIESMAIVRGMPRVEASKLRSRLTMLRMEMQTGGKRSSSLENDSLNGQLTDSLGQTQRSFDEKEFTEEEKKIFGYTLFNNDELTFEPSLSIATPGDYQLGPGDELVVDIWGASEANYPLQVSRDGTVQIRNLGPIYVSGLTIDEASKKIINRLTKIYVGLKSYEGNPPNTFASVSLGDIRSIKVTLVGEVRRPGTYTLTSLATVFNALYLSGGPTVNGSFRNILVRRNNKIISKLDVYDFLMNGDQGENIRLQDQDVIWVGPFQKRVETMGQVKRPGYYEVLDNETVANAIKFSGGYTDQAYTHRLKVTRKTSREKRIEDVGEKQINEFTLKNGDVIEIDSILDRYINRVEILGAVFRSGTYELTDSLTIGSLIEKAEGLTEDAFLDRALIFRKQPNLTTEAVAVNLQKVLNGTNPDVMLKREDVVRVLSIFDLKEEYHVRIKGEVQTTGEFPYIENMTLEDVITLAGGFKESASRSRIEVARRIKDNNGTVESFKTAEIHQFSVNETLALSPEDSKFVLQPFDQIYIRKSPAYEKQGAASIKGEINFPGEYVIKNKDERISDLIERAGGLTPYAYTEGAKLVRLNPDFLERIIEQEGVSSDSSYSLLQQSYSVPQINNNPRVRLRKRVEPETETIGIDLKRILQNPKSKYDITLQPGDTLKIPKELQTVKISGELLYPVSARYENSNNFLDYISQAGGFTKEADKKRSYIVYANGSVDRTKRILFFNNYPKVKPGAEIIVPLQPERPGLSPQAWIAIGTGLASIGFSVVSAISIISRLP